MFSHESEELGHFVNFFFREPFPLYGMLSKLLYVALSLSSTTSSSHFSTIIKVSNNTTKLKHYMQLYGKLDYSIVVNDCSIKVFDLFATILHKKVGGHGPLAHPAPPPMFLQPPKGHRMLHNPPLLSIHYHTFNTLSCMEIVY